MTYPELKQTSCGLNMTGASEERANAGSMRDADAIPHAQRAVQDDGTVCYFFGNTTVRVNETMKAGKMCLEPVAGDQVACGEWTELPIDRVYGYCLLLEKYLEGGESV